MTRSRYEVQSLDTLSGARTFTTVATAQTEEQAREEQARLMYPTGSRIVDTKTGKVL